MADRVFVDTNVFIYAEDDNAGPKQKKARAALAELVRSGHAVVSTQVLSEFFVVATKKLGLSAESARRRIEVLSQLDVVPVSPELVLGAIDLHRLNKLSYWDALIIRCASAAGCSKVLSEDLNAGQTIDGVRIEDPFGA